MKRQRDREEFEAVVSNANFERIPGFNGPRDKWLAGEESILLASLQRYSFGNWAFHAETLSRRFKKTFTPEEVREHYFGTYLEGELLEDLKRVNFNNTLTVQVHTSEQDDEMLNVSDRNDYSKIDPCFLQQLGYDPLRGDFREEYAPAVEDLIHDLSFKDADEYDKNFNFIVLDAYNYKVRQRSRFKTAIKEFQLVERYYIEKFQSFNSGNEIDNPYLGNESPISAKNLPACLEKNCSRPSKELSEDEKELCADLGIEPKFYIRYRKFLRRIDRKRIAGEFPEVLIPVNMTVAQCLQIINFMEKAGWIKTPNLLNVCDA